MRADVVFTVMWCHRNDIFYHIFLDFSMKAENVWAWLRYGYAEYITAVQAAARAGQPPPQMWKVKEFLIKLNFKCGEGSRDQVISDMKKYFNIADVMYIAGKVDPSTFDSRLGHRLKSYKEHYKLVWLPHLEAIPEVWAGLRAKDVVVDDMQMGAAVATGSKRPSQTVPPITNKKMRGFGQKLKDAAGAWNSWKPGTQEAGSSPHMPAAHVFQKMSAELEDYPMNPTLQKDVPLSKEKATVTCISEYICLHICAAYIHTCMHVYIHTYLHTDCIYIHTYTHMYMCIPTLTLGHIAVCICKGEGHGGAARIPCCS